MNWSNSIVFRFWLAMNALVFTLIFCLGGVYLWAESRHLDTALRSEGITAANTLNSAIGLFMLKEQYEQISPLAYSLLSQPNVQYVIVRDAAGRIVNQKGETVGQNNVLVEKVPLTYFQKEIGEVEIALRTDTLKRQITFLHVSTAFVTLIFSLLAAFLSLLVSRRLTAPLKKLVDATRKIAHGTRNVTVSEEGPKEIQELATAFNSMAETIAHHEQNLIEKIRRATDSLSEKIKTLQVMGDISHSVIANDFSRQEVIGIVLNRMQDLIGSDKLSLSLCSEEHGEEVELYLLKNNQGVDKFTLPLPQSPVGLVIHTKKPFLCNDRASLQQLSQQYFGLEEGTRAVLVLPLIARNKVIGTLNLRRLEGEGYNPNGVQQLAAFTNPIAIALDRAAAYESLRKLAFFDYLTGLPNLRFFKDLLNGALDEAKQHPHRMIAVMFLDLDRFKTINDTLGHDFGDRVIQHVADLLHNSVTASDTVCRISGDEFIILLTQIESVQNVIQMAEKLLQNFRNPLRIDGYEIPVTASIGISLHPTDGEDAESLIKHADTAMYRVKAQGKNGYHFYRPSVNDPTFERLILENDLRKALENNEFVVHYQPKINIQKGRITGIEALVRWQHPVTGLLPPIEFVPLAEETGLIVQIGEFVMRNACKQMADWQRKGFPPIPVSVNLSTRQFLQSDLVRAVTLILRETGLPPRLLELEITESMTLDVDRAVTVLSELKSLGLQLSIDDFGTGYSSLSYLQKLPIDRLKIDRSFVRDLPANPNNAAIVSTIIAMAHNLGLCVTAEGVETEQQALFLQENRCDEIQGYYFSRPLTSEEFEAVFDDLCRTAGGWIGQPGMIR